MRKRFLYLYLSFFFAVWVFSPVFPQDTTKVLFIGNSFMGVNDLPSLFKELSTGAGDQVVVASHTPGGASVGDTIQGTFAHMWNPLVYALIKSNDWDYLFLQDRQSRFALSYGQFPGDSKVIEGHIKIRDSLLFYHPCAHMIWFAGFGPKYGLPPYAYTGEALIDSIYQNYKYLEDTAGQVIAPIGPAFLRIIFGYPAINLWGPDNEHPSLAGSYLIASVLYSTIFKRSPIFSSFNPGIPAIVDSLLKMTGYQTTYDSLPFTGLNQITPGIIQIENELSISGYENCKWFLNDLPYASNNCVATINQSGNYYALAMDSNGCWFRTLEEWFTYQVHIGNPSGRNPFTVSPNPVSEMFSITSQAPLQEIRIFNIYGMAFLTIPNPSIHTRISTATWPDGVYIVHALSETDISFPCTLVVNH